MTFTKYYHRVSPLSAFPLLLSPGIELISSSLPVLLSEMSPGSAPFLSHSTFQLGRDVINVPPPSRVQTPDNTEGILLSRSWLCPSSALLGIFW